jgi:hypothetical protein
LLQGLTLVMSDHSSSTEKPPSSNCFF